MQEWKPHPKQEIALLSTVFETLYGGARGGGKTDAGMAWLLYEKDNPLYRALVIRKNSEDLKDWLDRSERMFSGTKARFVGKPAEIHFPSGAKIITGHLKDAQAYTKYQGHEYQRMLIEELTQIPTLENYLKLISSCRSTINIQPRIFATANPGGVGHHWVKKRFVDSMQPMRIFIDSVSKRSRIYIPATIDDNPTLMQNDPQYKAFLESLPPDLKAQWRYGSWETSKVKGAYYSDDVEHAQKENRVCQLATFPHVLVYVAWDLGISDTQVAIFYQLIGDQIRIIDTYEDNNKGYSFYVQMLREFAKKNIWQYAKMMLPHDGNKRSPESLRTFADELKEAGYEVQIIPRTKDKQRDIQESRTIFPRCWFDSEKCNQLLDALINYRRQWIEERGVFQDAPYHDWTSNFADAFQAMAVSLPELVIDEKEYERGAQRFIDSLSDKPRRVIPNAKTPDEWIQYQREAQAMLHE